MPAAAAGPTPGALWAAFRHAQRQTGLMRVVVTQIGSGGTIKRRMVDTAGRSDAFQREELVARALAVPLPYRPARAVPSTISAGMTSIVMVAEHDLAGPLLDLVTTVLAEGEAP